MKNTIYILIVFIIIGCSSNRLIKKSEYNGLLASVDSIMNVNYVPDEPGATIAITRQGETIYKEAFGMADLEQNIPMTTDMIFRLGSITKQFTAVSILLLEEQGKLNVTDDINKYIPDYPTHGNIITIENLLTHTSGIPSFTGFKNSFEIEQMNLTTSEILALFKDKPLDFEPGSRFSYSNSGYNVLGAIIERISGVSYETFVEHNIFQKSGMKNSFYEHPEEVIQNKILGYDKAMFGYKNAPFITMDAPFSAGGLRSSVEDMSLWNKSLQDEKLITKHSLEKAFTPFKLSSKESSNYGYGWFLKIISGYSAYSHGGGIIGFRTSGIYFPKKDLYIIILSNNTSKNPSDVILSVSTCLLNK